MVWNGSVLDISKCPDTSYYKGKNQKKRTGKRKAARKRRNPGSTGTHGRAWQGARPCPSHHGPWWALSLPVRLFLQRCVLCSFGASIWAAGFAYVGSFWASFASFFDPHGLSRFVLSSITWLITCKSTIKTQTSQNKRN